MLLVAMVSGLAHTVVADARSGSVATSLGMRPSGGFLDQARFDANEEWLGRPIRWTVAMAGRRSPSKMRASVYGQMISPRAVLPDLAHRLDVVMTVPLAFGTGSARTPEGQRAIHAKLMETAGGRWDADYAAVASNLVQGGYPDAVVRLGHEMTGPFYPWSAQGNPDAFVAAYRRVHRVMRAVAPGLRFEWNAARNTFVAHGPPAYPGDAFVDVIGLDVYYEPHKGDPVPFDDDVWSRRYERVLQAHRDFARSKGKPVSYAEWANGGVDEPMFIQRMSDWFRSLPASGPGRLLYQSYFNVNNPTYDLARYPQSHRRYGQLFGSDAGTRRAPAAATEQAPLDGAEPETETPTSVPEDVSASTPVPSTTSTTTSVTPSTGGSGGGGQEPASTSTTSAPTVATTAPPPTVPAARPNTGGVVLFDTVITHRAEEPATVALEQTHRWPGAPVAAGATYRLGLEVVDRALTGPVDVQLCFWQRDRSEQACAKRVTLVDGSPKLGPIELGEPSTWWRSPGWTWAAGADEVRVLFKDPASGALLNNRLCGTSCFDGVLPLGPLLVVRAALVAEPLTG